MNTTHNVKVAILGTFVLMLAENTLHSSEFVILGRDGNWTPRTASEDGAIILGERIVEDAGGLLNQTWLWRREQGFVSLDFVDGIVERRVLTDDGRAIFGFNQDGVATTWNLDGSIDTLGFRMNEIETTWDVTPNGDALVGTAPNNAFRWSSTDGMKQLSPIPGWQSSFALGISDDGSRVVGGSSSKAELFDESEATIWDRQNNEFRPLGLGRPNGEDTWARFVSRDGSTVVGVLGRPCIGCSRDYGTHQEVRPHQPFRWTEGLGIEPLGFLNGMSTMPTSVSSDGSVVVGNAEDRGRNFVWDEQHGMRELQTVLKEEHAIDALSGWLQLDVRMSSDTRVLYGRALECQGCPEDFWDPFDLQAWALFLDRPLVGSSIAGPTDFDFDGDVDSDDVDALVNEIVVANDTGVFDLSGDGIVDIDDLDQWLADAATANGFAAPYLLGDANLDGIVNASDLNALGQNWLGSPNAWRWGDFNADGVVNASDLDELGQNWLASIPVLATQTTAVPEPSGVTLLGLALLALMRTSRRDAYWE